MSTAPAPTATPVPPPTQHQLALMIWIAVFPTLTVLNLVLAAPLSGLPIVVRTLVLVTIVIYLEMPLLHRVRRRIHGLVTARRRR